MRVGMREGGRGEGAGREGEGRGKGGGREGGVDYHSSIDLLLKNTGWFWTPYNRHTYMCCFCSIPLVSAFLVPRVQRVWS